MMSDAIEDSKDVCDAAKIGVCSAYLVDSHARAARTIFLEKIVTMLETKLEFLVAFDVSNGFEQIFCIDITVSFHQHLLMKNPHLITILFYARQIELAMFEVFSKLFDVICLLWKDELIGCSADGAAYITEYLAGVVTHIQVVVLPKFFCVWCPR